MPRQDGPNKRRRDRLIVAAAKEGHNYTELAHTYGLSMASISVICTTAGYLRRSPWTEEMRNDQRARCLSRHPRWGKKENT